MMTLHFLGAQKSRAKPIANHVSFFGVCQKISNHEPPIKHHKNQVEETIIFFRPLKASDVCRPPTAGVQNSWSQNTHKLDSYVKKEHTQQRLLNVILSLDTVDAGLRCDNPKSSLSWEPKKTRFEWPKLKSLEFGSRVIPGTPNNGTLLW